MAVIKMIVARFCLSVFISQYTTGITMKIGKAAHRELLPPAQSATNSTDANRRTGTAPNHQRAVDVFRSPSEGSEF
jgi:hypothetical protein